MLYQLIGKRIFDILIVAVSVVLLSPLILSIIFLIKLGDTGPIFFRQKRIGKDLCLFNIYKFRSMPVDTGNFSSDKIDQVKLTWIGKFIRRTNIDELPQLFNVILGEMSIVGPRPSLDDQIELIKLRSVNGSFELRPGLTGMAQINSFDGMTVYKKAFFDGQYVNNVTFFNDVKIILTTFIYICKPPPVY